MFPSGETELFQWKDFHNRKNFLTKNAAFHLFVKKLPWLPQGIHIHIHTDRQAQDNLFPSIRSMNRALQAAYARDGSPDIPLPSPFLFYVLRYIVFYDSAFKTAESRIVIPSAWNMWKIWNQIGILYSKIKFCQILKLVN